MLRESDTRKYPTPRIGVSEEALLQSAKYSIQYILKFAGVSPQVRIPTFSYCNYWSYTQGGGGGVGGRKCDKS